MKNQKTLKIKFTIKAEKVSRFEEKLRLVLDMNECRPMKIVQLWFYLRQSSKIEQMTEIRKLMISVILCRIFTLMINSLQAINSPDATSPLYLQRPTTNL